MLNTQNNSNAESRYLSQSVHHMYTTVHVHDAMLAYFSTVVNYARKSLMGLTPAVLFQFFNGLVSQHLHLSG